MPEQTRLKYNVVWWSALCEEHPPTALARDESFATDFPMDRVVVRIDFGVPVVLLGAVVSSRSASSVDIRAADSSRDVKGFVLQGRRVLEPGLFVNPLNHRARVAASDHPDAIELRLKRPPAVNNHDGAENNNNNSNDKSGGNNAAAEPVPHIVVDVDVRGLWEPAQKLGLERLAFIGYVAPNQAEPQSQQLPTRAPNVSEPVAATSPAPPNATPPLPRASGVVRPRDPSDDVAATGVTPPTPVLPPHHHQQQQQQAPPQLRPHVEPPQPAPQKQQALPQPQNQPQQQQNNAVNNSNNNVASTQPPLQGCTFVLSGFQNPLRGQLRDSAVALGATCAPDWGPGCTHLVCAVAGTPKFNDVLRSGFGWIVSREWIEQCFTAKRRLPEQQYFVGSGGPGLLNVPAKPAQQSQQQQQQPQLQQQAQQTPQQPSPLEPKLKPKHELW